MTFFDGIILFAYWIGPIWVYASYKLANMAKLYVLQVIFPILILAVASVVAILQVEWFITGINVYGLLGYYSLTWPIMFWIGYAILIYRNYYGPMTSAMISFLATIAALGVWEIPVRVVTVYLTPTLTELVLTLILAFPYVVMIIPFRLESKWNQIEGKSFPRYWRQYFKDTIVFPIIIGVALVALLFLNDGPTLLFTHSGYPEQPLQYILRIGYAGIFLEYLWHTPKRRVFEHGTREQVIRKI